MAEKYLCIYEYQIRFFNEANGKEEICHGILPAYSVVDAVEKLTDYYGDENIFDIQKLTIIMDSEVLDFNDFSNSTDDDIGFTINLIGGH